MSQARADRQFRHVGFTSRQAERAETARLARAALAEIGGVLHVRATGPVWTIRDARTPVARLAALPGCDHSGHDAHPVDEPDRALARLTAASRAGGKAVAGFSDDATVEIPDLAAYRAVRPDAAQLVLQPVAMAYWQAHRVTWQNLAFFPADAAAAAAELRSMASRGVLAGPDPHSAARAGVLLGLIHGCYPIPVRGNDGMKFLKSPHSASAEALRWLAANPSQDFDVPAAGTVPGGR